MRIFWILCCALFSLTSPAFSERFSLTLWNIAASEQLEQRKHDFKDFGAFAKGSDAIVLVELLGKDDINFINRESGLLQDNAVVSDFITDKQKKIHLKLEVGVLTPHTISRTLEFDPSPDKNSSDKPVDIPSWIPESQNRSKGSRGWLWVEIKEQKLVIAAVHLKSSGGARSKSDEVKNSFKRENIAAALAEEIKQHQTTHSDWSYIVAGDFNVSPGDRKDAKSGIDFDNTCDTDTCSGYDQTHAIFQSGLVPGFYMRNLVSGLSNTFYNDKYTFSPIDIVYGKGPLFDKSTRVVARKGYLFGSDHHAIRIDIE